MEELNFVFPGATQPVVGRAHVGVVASGDLEILLEPAGAGGARVRVRTAVEGEEALWKATLERFFIRHPVAAAVEINDGGATPGTVTLRLQQALGKAAK